MCLFVFLLFRHRKCFGQSVFYYVQGYLSVRQLLFQVRLQTKNLTTFALISSQTFWCTWLGSTKRNGRESKRCLGRVFKLELGCFYFGCNVAMSLIRYQHLSQVSADVFWLRYMFLGKNKLHRLLTGIRAAI